MSLLFHNDNPRPWKRIGEAVEHKHPRHCRFDCDTWADCSALISSGFVFPTGTRRPDFVCVFKDGTLGVFEGKGTTRGRGTANSQARAGKLQTATLEPTSGTVKVRCCTAVSLERDTATRNTRLLLLDPPADSVGATGRSPLQVDISRERILAAARTRAYREKVFGDIVTLFKHGGKTLELKRTPFVEDKRHGWLNISD